MNDNNNTLQEDELEQAVTFSPEAYISPEYARAERDRLWRKVWLQAGRVEEVAEVGQFITYEILDDSVIIVRSSEHQINAFHNVCPHRGRRLVDVPAGKRNASGKKQNFFCNYHGWRFDLNGDNNQIPLVEDWQGALDGCSDLSPVKMDVWGGWIWINLDPDCEPLLDYLAPAAALLDPF